MTQISPRARIDEALSRIEAAVKARDGADRRHAALRAEVAQSIAALDALITGGRPA